MENDSLNIYFKESQQGERNPDQERVSIDSLYAMIDAAEDEDLESLFIGDIPKSWSSSLNERYRNLGKVYRSLVQLKKLGLGGEELRQELKTVLSTEVYSELHGMRERLDMTKDSAFLDREIIESGLFVTESLYYEYSQRREFLENLEETGGSYFWIKAINKFELEVGRNFSRYQPLIKFLSRVSDGDVRYSEFGPGVLGQILAGAIGDQQTWEVDLIDKGNFDFTRIFGGVDRFFNDGVEEYEPAVQRDLIVMLAMAPSYIVEHSPTMIRGKSMFENGILLDQLEKALGPEGVFIYVWTNADFDINSYLKKHNNDRFSSRTITLPGTNQFITFVTKK